MKYLKLFEDFNPLGAFSKDRSPKFEMPDLYTMPSGLSGDKVYIIRITQGCDNMIYALVDLDGLESIYRALNLHLLAEKISWYAGMIYPNAKELKNKFLQSVSKAPQEFKDAAYPTRNREYDQEFLLRKEWSIEIVAESKKEGFPYHVYFGWPGQTPMSKKLEDMIKGCKVCGMDPGTGDVTPGGITCDLGSEQLVVFDRGMSMRLSPIEFPKDEGNPVDGEDRGGYYVRFDKPGAFLAVWFGPAYREYEKRFLAGDIPVDPKNIFELLAWKSSLGRARDLIQGREGSKDFLDHVFAYLIDHDVPTPLIREISNIMVSKEFNPETFSFHKAECNYYINKNIWYKGELSSTPDFRDGRFFIALPADKTLAQAIIAKLPKDYKEYYAGLDSLDDAAINLIKSKASASWHKTPPQEFKERLLKYALYLPDGEVSLRKIPLYDGPMLSDAEFEEQTGCTFEFGVRTEISLAEVASLTPIELYFKIFRV